MNSSLASAYRFSAILRVSFAIVLIVGIAAISAGSLHAAVYGGGGLNMTPVSGISSSTNISDLIVTLITFLLDFVLIVAVLAVVVAGFFLIASGGDEAQKDKAKNIIIYAVIGILVIGFARVIVIFANSLF